MTNYSETWMNSDDEIRAYLNSLQDGEEVIETGESCMTGKTGIVYTSTNEATKGKCVKWEDGMGTSVTWGTRRLSDTGKEVANAKQWRQQMAEPYDTIHKLTAMFGLTDIEPSEDGKIVAGFKGFVVPPNYINSYNEVALHVQGRVTVAPPKDSGLFGLYASFTSIDDSGMTIHSPHESKEKALKRLEAFRAKVEEWHPFMPPEFSEWEEWAQQNGVTADKW
jgi:hypothetical protein